MLITTRSIVRLPRLSWSIQIITWVARARNDSGVFNYAEQTVLPKENFLGAG